MEERLEVKRRRKLQRKEMKIAKAKAEGRDLEQERRELEERTKSGEGARKREQVRCPKRDGDLFSGCLCHPSCNSNFGVLCACNRLGRNA